jgi:hypothetical protein
MYHACGKGLPASIYAKRSELSENDIFNFWKKHNVPHYPTVITADNVRSAVDSGHLVGRHGLYYTKWEDAKNEKQRTEHWCCLSMPDRRRMAFFDPYGQNPLNNGSYETPFVSLIGQSDDEQQRAQSSEDDDEEDKAIRRRRPKQYEVFFSHGDCQAPGTNVCGEYCALFGAKGFDLNTFYDAYHLRPVDTLVDSSDVSLSRWAPASINEPTRLTGNEDGAVRFQQLANDKRILSVYNSLK